MFCPRCLTSMMLCRCHVVPATVQRTLPNGNQVEVPECLVLTKGDLSPAQKQMVYLEREIAYKRWVLEGELVHKDGLQGPKGFAAQTRNSP